MSPAKHPPHQFAEAEALNAQERINKVVRDIRSIGSPISPAPGLPPAANWSCLGREASDAAPAGFQQDPREVSSRYTDRATDARTNDTKCEISTSVSVKFALMIGLAALVACAITTLPSLQPHDHWRDNDKNGVGSIAHMPQDTTTDAPRLRRLVVEDQQAKVNEPILLGVAVAPPSSSGSLLIAGLLPGTRVSSGASLSDNSWEVPLRDIGGVYVYAPVNFIGAMNAFVALLSPNRKAADSHSMRLEWIAEAEPPQPMNKVEVSSATATIVSKSVSDSEGHEVLAKRENNGDMVTPVATKAIDPQEAAVLMERGRELLANGDVASARLAFRRAVEAGRADAARALAMTYDPSYLAEHKLWGVVGDRTEARTWYERAKELGSTEAERSLR